MRRLALAALALAVAGCSGKPAAPAERRIVILHTNDIHGRVRPGGPVPGLAAVAAHIRKARALAQSAGARVIVVDCGDFFQGTPEGDMLEGRLVIDCMNAIGYDALCLGNHDFDLGPKVVEALKARARFPFLAANVVRKGGRDPPDWAVSSVIFEDVNVEIAGLTTSEMPQLTTEKAREGLEFEREERTLERFRWRAGVVRILATHVGLKRDRELAAKFPDLAAILGGHSHEKACEQVGGVHILQSLCHGAQVGRLELVVRDGKVVSASASLEAVDPKQQDPEVKAIIDRATPDIDRVMDEVVGELAQEMPAGKRGDMASSPLGNHLTDIMRAATGVDVALHNRTGIRAPLRKGRVRLRDIYQVSPFGNTVVTMTLTGAQLRALLEFSLSDGTRLLLEMSGAELEFDAAADKGRRVTAVTVGGAPLDPAKTYRVATNSFLAPGGDGHSVFERGKERTDTLRVILDLHRAALEKERPLKVEFRNRIRAKS